jgi:hypothetical protein
VHHLIVVSLAGDGVVSPVPATTSYLHSVVVPVGANPFCQSRLETALYAEKGPLARFEYFVRPSVKQGYAFLKP